MRAVPSMTRGVPGADTKLISTTRKMNAMMVLAMATRANENARPIAAKKFRIGWFVVIDPRCACLDYRFSKLHQEIESMVEARDGVCSTVRVQPILISGLLIPIFMNLYLY